MEPTKKQTAKNQIMLLVLFLALLPKESFAQENPKRAIPLVIAPATEPKVPAPAPMPADQIPQTVEVDGEKYLKRPKDDRGIFTFALENDVFNNQDNGYTNGTRISWLSPENTVPPWIENVANGFPLFAKNGYKRYSVGMGQNMYAPDDLSQRALITNDRPYAGWLYGTVGLVSDTGYRLDNLQLSLGVVGPASLAAQTQDAVHGFIDSPDPRGWDNQLRDEPAVMLTYERSWRGLYEFSPFGFGADITPHVGGSIGNVYTMATTGFTVRFGYDLPADYGPPRIRPSLPGSDFFVPTRSLGWYLFAGAEGQAVARNIFLDGNTFRDSHSVDKNPWVGAMQAGIAFTAGNTRVAYTQVYRTKEFDQQVDHDQFGALTVSYRF